MNMTSNKEMDVYIHPVDDGLKSSILMNFHKKSELLFGGTGTAIEIRVKNRKLIFRVNTTNGNALIQLVKDKTLGTKIPVIEITDKSFCGFLQKFYGNFNFQKEDKGIYYIDLDNPQGSAIQPATEKEIAVVSAGHKLTTPENIKEAYEQWKSKKIESAAKGGEIFGITASAFCKLMLEEEARRNQAEEEANEKAAEKPVEKVPEVKEEKKPEVKKEEQKPEVKVEKPVEKVPEKKEDSEFDILKKEKEQLLASNYSLKMKIGIMKTEKSKLEERISKLEKENKNLMKGITPSDSEFRESCYGRLVNIMRENITKENWQVAEVLNQVLEELGFYIK